MKINKEVSLKKGKKMGFKKYIIFSIILIIVGVWICT